MIKRLLNWFKPKPEITELASNRRHVKDVKPDENIQIEWHRIAGGIGYVKCVNNDPETKKILIEVRWNNWEETNSPEKERKVFNYSDRELLNFHLLNPKDIAETENEEEDNTVK